MTLAFQQFSDQLHYTWVMPGVVLKLPLESSYAGPKREGYSRGYALLVATLAAVLWLFSCGSCFPPCTLWNRHAWNKNNVRQVGAAEEPRMHVNKVPRWKKLRRTYLWIW